MSITSLSLIPIILDKLISDLCSSQNKIQQIHYTFETTITLSVSYFNIFQPNLLSLSSFLTLMPLITCYHLTSVTMIHPEHVQTYFTVSHKSHYVRYNAQFLMFLPEKQSLYFILHQNKESDTTTRPFCANIHLEI